jgi:hypothetical protein
MFPALPLSFLGLGVKHEVCLTLVFLVSCTSKRFSLLHIVQTGSGVHPTSYKMGTGGTFPGLKWQGREADHSPPTSAEVKKMWIYTSTPPYVFRA